MSDPYSTLGVRPNASESEIREAYRRLAREHHPDRWVSASPEQQRAAAVRMTELNLAYDEIGPDRSAPAPTQAQTSLAREEAARREKQRRWEEAERQGQIRAEREREEALRREREATRRELLERQVAARKAKEIATRRQRLEEIKAQLEADAVRRAIDDLRDGIDRSGRRRWFSRGRR